MKKYIKILKNCPLFYDIEEEQLLKMLACLNVRVEKFDKKYTVMPEGSTAKYIGIILSGSVQLYNIDYFGNRSILDIFGPSESFAEAFACSGIGTTPVTVVANEPCEIMFIESERIMRTCSNQCAFHQQLIFNLMRDLASKVITFHQRIEIISKRTTREKLISYLLFQSKKAKSKTFVIPFDRQELADYLEVDRSGLSSEIGKLKKEGFLNCSKNQFELL